MKGYSSYRLIELDEEDRVWEILDELTDSVLVDQERMDVGTITIGFVPMDYFGEVYNWH